MQKKFFSLIVLLIFGAIPFVYTQKFISVQEAIDTALMNHIGLLISRNEAKIIANNTSRAQAGMLPSIDLNAGTDFASNTLKQNYSTGGEINKKGVGTNANYAAVIVNWTLFDGSKMFATYHKLKLLKSMSELQVQMRAEEIILEVTSSYNDIVRIKNILKGAQQNFTIYEERVKLSDAKFKIGKSAKTEFLQASVDLNTQRNLVSRLQKSLKSGKINLNRIMQRDISNEFEVAEEMDVNETIVLQDILTKLENANSQLQQLRMTEIQRDWELKEIKSYSYPRLDLNAGYNFSKNSSTQGLFLENQSYGPSVGLTFYWNLFNGGIQRKQIENAKIQIENSRLIYQDGMIGLKAMVADAWHRYRDELELARIEKESLQMAEENLSISLERLKYSTISILELKDVQQSFEDSLVRLANANYEAKKAEIELLFLVGGLVK
ncbi:MAG: TolC family protein [Bacteroidota bacterium]|nr:TolC family protein [Bacteroidota bacterium]